MMSKYFNPLTYINNNIEGLQYLISEGYSLSRIYELPKNPPIRNLFKLADFYDDWTFIHSHPFRLNKRPPFNDYVIIGEDIPNDTLALFEYLKEEHLLFCDINFKLYYEDERCKKAVNDKAREWLDALKSIVHWTYVKTYVNYMGIDTAVYIKTKEYYMLSNQIYDYLKNVRNGIIKVKLDSDDDFEFIKNTPAKFDIEEH